MSFLRKALMVLCLLLVFSCGSALALETTPLPKDLIGYILPDGLEATVSRADGLLTIKIDDDATNWAAAIADSQLMTNVQSIVHIKMPGDVKVGDYVDCFYNPELEWLDADVEANESNRRQKKIVSRDSYGVAGYLPNPNTPVEGAMPYPENGLNVADYIADLEYISPNAIQQDWYVCWYNPDYSRKSYGWQKLTIRIEHTSPKPFQTEGPALAPAARIVTNATSAADVKASKADGSVTYEMERGITAETWLEAPANAVSFDYNGMKGSGVTSLIESGGKKYACFTSTVHPQMPVLTNAFPIKFYDASGNVVERLTLEITCQIPDGDAWPVYNTDYTPIPASRLVIDNQATNAGYASSLSTYNAQNGQLVSSFNADIRQSSASALGAVNVSVKAPDGAKSFRYYEFASNSNILGKGANSTSGMDTKLNETGGKEGGVPYAISEWQPGYEYEAFRKITPANNAINIYIPQSTITNNTQLLIVNWYSDEAGTQLLQREFMWETVEPFTVVERTIPIQAEHLLDKPVKKPHVIGPSGRDWQNWQLIITTYYQEGTRARHFELRLVGGDGKPVRLTEDITIYLPYPSDDVYQQRDKWQYGVHHYTTDLYNDPVQKAPNLNGDKMQTVEATDYGIKFQTRSFSPFVLSWEEAPEPTPSTSPEASGSPSPSPTASVAPTVTPSPTASTQPEQKLEGAKPFGLTAVPASLSAHYKTVTELKEAMHVLLLGKESQLSGVAHFDIKPMYSLDNGATWVVMDESDWPADKEIIVFISYNQLKADGSVNGSTHDFLVVHKFTRDGSNHKANQNEYPLVTKTEDGLLFTLKGLSPVSVGWTKITPASPEIIPDIPQTGDSMPLALLLCLAVLSMGLCVLAARRMQKR